MDKNPHNVIPLFFPFAVFVIIIIASYFSEGKKRAKLKQLSSGFSGSLAKFSFIPSFNGEYLGFKFNISLIPAGKNTPPYLKIYLHKNSLVDLIIMKESVLSGMGKQIGIIKEIKINDEVFDKEFLIFSRKQDIAANYLRDITTKETIRELFNEGYTFLKITGKKISIHKPNYSLENDLSALKVKETIQKMNLLTR
ncbi:MAG: hypothetical protein V2A64_00840 [Candidatus Omnitrophota bacterium]